MKKVQWIRLQIKFEVHNSLAKVNCNKKPAILKICNLSLHFLEILLRFATFPILDYNCDKRKEEKNTQVFSLKSLECTLPFMFEPLLQSCPLMFLVSSPKFSISFFNTKNRFSPALLSTCINLSQLSQFLHLYVILNTTNFY